MKWLIVKTTACARVLLLFGFIILFYLLFFTFIKVEYDGVEIPQGLFREQVEDVVAVYILSILM